MLVVADDAPAEQRRSRLAYQVLWGTGAAADVLVWTVTESESRLGVVASLPATIMREGRLLHAARGVSGGRDQGVEDIAFHAQQAVEKALKTFLTWHGPAFRKTHNLVELGEASSELDPSLEALLRCSAPLTEYAWKFRYPGLPEEPTAEEAEGALGTASQVYEAVLERLPEEVRL